MADVGPRIGPGRVTTGQDDDHRLPPQMTHDDAGFQPTRPDLARDLRAPGTPPRGQTQSAGAPAADRRSFGHGLLMLALGAHAPRPGRACPVQRGGNGIVQRPTADAPAQGLAHPAALARVFAADVKPRLEVPAEEQATYSHALRQQLERAGVAIERPQWLVLVDRSARVQAAMVWWVDATGAAGLVGATPASTGRPSGFEHFATPLGVFAHTLDNPDFRAEGTVNALGIRGYGERGMRVYDFGWVVAERGWAPGSQEMRLQMHATDPVHLEPRLGTRASKGCIRVPARLNTLLDRWGVLDADYDAAGAATGRWHWVLRPNRIPTPWAGRWLVVVETDRAQRPIWSEPPAQARRPHQQ